MRNNKPVTQQMPTSTKELYILYCRAFRSDLLAPAIPFSHLFDVYNRADGRRVLDCARHSTRDAKRNQAAQDKSEIERVLFRLGERVERAELNHDILTICAVERQLTIISAAQPEMWIAQMVIAGQNNIRIARNLSELHV